MNDEKTLTLVFEEPIVIGSASFHQVILGVPKVKHLKAAAKAGSGIEAVAILISMGGNITMLVVDEMTQTDFQKAERFLDRFSMTPPETSATSSPK
jgi:hypothetical protein